MTKFFARPNLRCIFNISDNFDLPYTFRRPPAGLPVRPATANEDFRSHYTFRLANAIGVNFADAQQASNRKNLMSNHPNMSKLELVAKK